MMNENKAIKMGLNPVEIRILDRALTEGYVIGCDLDEAHLFTPNEESSYFCRQLVEKGLLVLRSGDNIRQRYEPTEEAANYAPEET